MNFRIFGILLGVLMLFGGSVGASSAAGISDTVNMQSTIPTTAGFNVLEDALTFNLANTNWVAPNEPGAVDGIHATNTGNQKVNIYGRATPDTGILFQLSSLQLSNTDTLVTDINANAAKQLPLVAKAPAGKAPGVYDNVLTVSAVPIP